ncbi:hypothetical protein F2P79_010086 [Pimephales promelas]|nr:hypothetical protein F2P79_010086 [Pimephales promelas]
MSNCTYWLGHGTGCLRSYSLPVKSVCDWVLEGSGRGILSFLSVLERVWIEKDRGLVLHIPPLASPSPCSLSLHPSFLPPGPPVSGWINPPGPSSHNPFDYPHFTVPSCELCAGITLCLELKAGFGSALTDNLGLEEQKKTFNFKYLINLLYRETVRTCSGEVHWTDGTLSSRLEV